MRGTMIRAGPGGWWRWQWLAGMAHEEMGADLRRLLCVTRTLRHVVHVRVGLNQTRGAARPAKSRN
jgi:hypothetical protein